jgi:hypothetical protein
MPETEHLPLEAWGDLRVGDRVYFSWRIPGDGNGILALQRYDLIELWSATAPISGDPDALAVVRSDRGEVFTVNVRMISRV